MQVWPAVVGCWHVVSHLTQWAKMGKRYYYMDVTTWFFPSSRFLFPSWFDSLLIDID